MSAAKCAVCAKTAYPLESVTVLERTYHKACFKCFVCKQPLNLKPFKGYEGRIYCSTHIPQADPRGGPPPPRPNVPPPKPPPPPPPPADPPRKGGYPLRPSGHPGPSLPPKPGGPPPTYPPTSPPPHQTSAPPKSGYPDVEKLTREIENLQEEVVRLTKLKSDHITQLEHKNSVIGQLNHTLTVQRNEVARLSIRLDEARFQYKKQADADKSDEISALRSYITNMEQQLAQALKTCEESTTRAKQLQQELDMDKCRHLEAEIRLYVEELRILKVRDEHNQRQVDALKSQTEDITILNAKLFAKERELSTLQAAHKEQGERLVRQHDEVIKLGVQVTTLQQRMINAEQSHATELLVLKNNNNKLEAEVTALRRSLNETCEKVSANLETLGNMEIEAETLRKENGKLQGSTVALQKEVAGKDGVLEQLRKILGDAQKETEHWKNTARSLQEKLERSMTNAAQSEMATSEFMAKYTKSVQEVDESKEHLARLQTELIDNRAENEQLNMEVVTLNNLIEELREENTAMHTQLQEAEEMQEKLAEQHEKINRVAQEQSDTIKTLQTTTTRQAQSMHELQQENSALKSKGTHHTKYLWEQERQDALAKVHRLESEIEVLRSENAKIRNTQRDEAAILAYRDERERLGGDISSVVNFLAESHKLAVQLQSSVSAANYTILKWHEFTSKAINSQEERVQQSTVVTVPVYGIGNDYVDKVLSVLNDRGEQCNPTLVFYHDTHISPEDPANELAVLVSQDNEKDKELETIVRELGYAHVLKLQQGPTDIDKNGTFPLEITGENIIIKQNILHKLFDVIGNLL